MKNFFSLLFLTFSMFVYSQTASPVANDQAFTIDKTGAPSGTLTGTDSDSSSSDLAYQLLVHQHPEL